LFTPSKSQAGTIAFEDLWPYYGDYDFNDVALNYQVVLKLNSKVWLFKWIFICNVKSNGAGFTNGIGIELKSIISQIKVSPVLFTVKNYITLNNRNGSKSDPCCHYFN
jgi:LruC domain-containing protein